MSLDRKIFNMQKSRGLRLRLREQRGFTLLEAMIGFFILTIGMLGIGSLQGLSLKAGKTAVYGSVAMMKVDELFESMRANPEGMAAYKGDGADNGCTGTKNCTPDELAADDVYWWKQNITAGLPATASTLVEISPAALPSKLATATVTITWDERDDVSEGGSTSLSYTITADICQANPC